MEESPSGVTWVHFVHDSMRARRLEEQADVLEQMLTHVKAWGSSSILMS